MELKLSDLRFVIIPGQGVHAQDLNYYDSAYALWKSVWTQTISELSPGKALLNSDGFTRQDRFGALFRGDECLGFISIRKADLRLAGTREDSLLTAWTGEAFELLGREGHQIAIASYLTVSPECRGEIQAGLNLKFLLCDLVTLNFLDMGGDAMTGTMRVNRGTHKSAYASGATFLAKSTMYGVEVDLVAYFRSNLVERLPDLHLWTRTLWDRRLHLEELPANRSNWDRKSA